MPRNTSNGALSGSVCAVADGVVSFTGVGTCTLTAHVADGTNHAALDGSPQSFVVAPTVPGAPTILGLERGDGSVTLRWSAPASAGGSAITGYRVSARPGTASCSTSGALTCVVGGLTPGVRYHFTVVASNGVGTSVPSTSVDAVAAKRIVIGNFKRDSAIVIGSLQAQLVATIKAMKAHHLTAVTAIGYANLGAKNTLSVQRAQAVATFLGANAPQLGLNNLTATVVGGVNTATFGATAGGDRSANRCVVLLAS